MVVPDTNERSPLGAHHLALGGAPTPESTSPLAPSHLLLLHYPFADDLIVRGIHRQSGREQTLLQETADTLE